MRALIVSSDRFEDSELSEPLQQLQSKGVEVDIAAPQQRPITGKHGHRVSAGLALSAVRAEDYDVLLLPGGEAPASLRKIPEAVAIARHFLQADKPVAAICHGPQLLIATGLMAGRTATCYRAVKRELEAAGANYPVLCSSHHQLPLLAASVSRYVPRSSLIEHGNRHDRDTDYLDLARQAIGSRGRDRTS
jgi:protease I